MSPDWSAKEAPVPYAKLGDPQTLNLYAYVGNNPLSRFDPDGHYECTGSKATCKTFDKAVDQLRKADAHFKPGTAQRTQLDKVLGVIGEKGKAKWSCFHRQSEQPQRSFKRRSVGNGHAKRSHYDHARSVSPGAAEHGDDSAHGS